MVFAIDRIINAAKLTLAFPSDPLRALVEFSPLALDAQSMKYPTIKAVGNAKAPPRKLDAKKIIGRVARKSHNVEMLVTFPTDDKELSSSGDE
jgi:hypothetical protein